MKGFIAQFEPDFYWFGFAVETVVMVESKREIGAKVEQETRFYITSLVLLAQAIGPMIRDHWAVESAPQTHTRRRFEMN